MTVEIQGSQLLKPHTSLYAKLNGWYPPAVHNWQPQNPKPSGNQVCCHNALGSRCAPELTRWQSPLGDWRSYQCTPLKRAASKAERLCYVCPFLKPLNSELKHTPGARCCWGTPDIPREVHEFEVSLCCMVRPCLKKQRQRSKQQSKTTALWISERNSELRTVPLCS